MVNAKLLICVPCRDRKSIVEECLPTIRNGMQEGDVLACYNDGSTEYDADFLLRWCFEVRSFDPGIGIEAQRKLHFKEFSERWEKDGFTHLYLTDSDALHDPLWRYHALRIQEEIGGFPLCLYNTIVHARIPGNTIEDDSDSPVVWRRVAPGVSYLLTPDHVKAVMEQIDEMQNWDWDVPRFLGSRFAVTQTSFTDHLGKFGMHHPKDAGYDEGDRALHPTDWLVNRRREAVKNIMEKTNVA